MTTPAAGYFTPAPGAAPTLRMLAAQTKMELRLLLRNGEQVGLTLIIPLMVEFFFNLPVLYALNTPRRIDFVVPSVLALAVMSASFTGLAIGTGFERKYAVLKRLGATALSRRVLLLGKTCSVLLLQVLQVALICGLGLILGWHPSGNAFWAAALIVLGTFTFGGLGLLLAGLADHRLLVHEATDDRLHQTARAPLFPEATQLLHGLVDAGALASCWSGAGPSLLAVCAVERVESVRAAGEVLMADAGVAGVARILPSDTSGLTILG